MSSCCLFSRVRAGWQKFQSAGGGSRVFPLLHATEGGARADLTLAGGGQALSGADRAEPEASGAAAAAGAVLPAPREMVSDAGHQ